VASVSQTKDFFDEKPKQKRQNMIVMHKLVEGIVVPSDLLFNDMHFNCGIYSDFLN